MKIPVNRIFDFGRCFGAETDHRFSLLSILRFTSSHGIPGEGSLALRSNSNRKSGLSIESPGCVPGSESSNSLANRIRSNSDNANADLSTSSCAVDIQLSLCGSTRRVLILVDELGQEKRSLGSRILPTVFFEHIDLLGVTVSGEIVESGMVDSVWIRVFHPSGRSNTTVAVLPGDHERDDDELEGNHLWRHMECICYGGYWSCRGSATPHTRL